MVDDRPIKEQVADIGEERNFDLGIEAYATQVNIKQYGYFELR